MRIMQKEERTLFISVHAGVFLEQAWWSQLIDDEVVILGMLHDLTHGGRLDMVNEHVWPAVQVSRAYHLAHGRASGWRAAASRRR